MSSGSLHLVVEVETAGTKIFLTVQTSLYGSVPHLTDITARALVKTLGSRHVHVGAELLKKHRTVDRLDRTKLLKAEN